MVALLVAVGLGWSAELVVQATLPLLILDRGGDASLVGLAAAAYALPTLLLRPVIGRRIDRSGHALAHRAGGLLVTVAPLAFVLPSLAILPLARLGQGLGWAMFGTANNVVLARLAPPARRAEASAYFNVMWALGFLAGPPLALALYASVSREAPFVVAALFAASGLAAALVLARLGRGTVALHPPVVPAAGDEAPATGGRLGRFLEPTAVPAMAVLALFMASQALFLGFAPVYARSVGAADEVLATFYPVYGVLLAIGQLVLGRVSDRFGRRETIILGSVLGSAGLGLAWFGGGWTTFLIGAAIYAIAAAIVNPTAAATVIDRLAPERVGVGMATFSMGYQVAAGLGGAAWGALIATAGFPAAFPAALAMQVGCVALALRALGPRRSREPVTP